MNQKNKTLLVWDFADSPPSGYHSIVLWQSFDCEYYPKAISMPKIVEEHADSLKKRYLKIIYDLGEKELDGRSIINQLQLSTGFNYWWLSLIIEKCNYSKSTWINDAIRLLAFESLINKIYINNIKLVSSNVLLASCFRLLCTKRKIIFDWQRLPEVKEKQYLVKRSFKLLPEPLKSLVWLLYYVISRWPLKGVGVKEWKSTEGQITFISYLFNLEPTSSAGHYESCYWAHLPDSLRQDGISTNWLHIYVEDREIPSARNAAELIHGFNQTSNKEQIHTTLDAFLDWKIIRSSLSDWISLYKINGNLQKLGPSSLGEEFYLWPFIQKDINKSFYGKTALSNLIYFNLFKEALRSLPKQTKGFYLQENQGWEFGLIQAWRELTHGSLIGVPHTTVRFWDLRYFFDDRFYNNKTSNRLPRPSTVAVNGKLMRKCFIDGGYKQSELVDVEALRYLFLNTKNKNNNNSIDNDATVILVLGDYLAENTHLQMQLLDEAFPSISTNITLLVKPHPNCHIISSDYPRLKMDVTMDSIPSLLSKCNMAYTSNITSAALDAYCANVPVISILNPRTLNMSPLLGFDGIEFVSGAGELVVAINKIKNKKYNKIFPEDIFWLDESLPLWKNLLSS